MIVDRWSDSRWFRISRFGYVYETISDTVLNLKRYFHELRGNINYIKIRAIEIVAYLFK